MGKWSRLQEQILDYGKGGKEVRKEIRQTVNKMDEEFNKADAREDEIQELRWKVGAVADALTEAVEILVERLEERR